MDRIEIKLASDEVDAKTGEFSGYGAVFGNLDSYGDVIAKGAFKTTLREWEERGKLPPMLLQHGGGGLFSGSSTDGIPIGVWTGMEENSKGLKVSGRLDPLDTDEAKKIYAGLKNGSLDGLSIGFRVRKSTLGTKPGEPERTLQDIDLMEVSIVTFPANGKARVSAVKNFDGDFWRAVENSLREDDELKLSNAKAVSAIAIFKKHLREGGGERLDVSREADDGAVAELIRRNITLFKGASS